MAPPHVAIDARLVHSTQTGDRAYWDGLLHGLRKVAAPDVAITLFFDADPGPIIRTGPWKCAVVPARSSRWWSIVQFPLAAHRAGAEVVHTQYSLSPLVRRGGITTIHDVSFYIGPEWFRPRDRVLLRTTLPGTVRRAARVITVSETSRQEIEHYLPIARGKVRVTPNALPTWFRPLPRDQALPLVAQHLGLTPPYALTVGTRWPRKNLDLAVQAVLGLPEADPLRLAITGKSGWGDEAQHPRVVRTGYVDDELIGALYAGADLYLAPSRHEGFGIPLLEAWASDCPVVCSSGGALPEVAGDAAMIVPGWTPAEWTATLTALRREPAKLDVMRAAGHRRGALYSWASTARGTLDAYREAAALAGGRS